MPKQAQIISNSSDESASGARVGVSTRVNHAENSQGQSDGRCWDREIQSCDEKHHKSRGSHFHEIVVGSLSIVKLKPFLVAELPRVPSATRIGISLLSNVSSQSISVFFPKVFLHKLFGENPSASPAREHEPNEDYFKGDDDSYNEYIAVSVRHGHGEGGFDGVNLMHVIPVDRYLAVVQCPNRKQKNKAEDSRFSMFIFYSSEKGTICMSGYLQKFEGWFYLQF